MLGVGVRFGIQYATFRMPVIVFVVDSSYHVFVEGTVAALCYRKFGPRR